MNKQAQKELRALAAELTRIHPYEVKKGTGYVKGSVLIDKGIKEVEGKPVRANRTYQSKGDHQFRVNHYTRLKKAYKRKGKRGGGTGVY